MVSYRFGLVVEDEPSELVCKMKLENYVIWVEYMICSCSTHVQQIEAFSYVSGVSIIQVYIQVPICGLNLTIRQCSPQVRVKAYW